MSFHIILIDNTKNKLIAAIADKRIGRASFDNDGKVDMKTWELVDDNSCKIIRITEHGCLIPFTDDNAQLGWRTDDNIDPYLVQTIGRMIDEYEQFDS